MATGRSTQLTKQAGEYLVSAELCRRGLISTTFTGNVPSFDILAINKHFQAIPVQVKTIAHGSWQFDAKEFIEIEKSDDTQKVKRKSQLDKPNLICVLVKLGGQNKADFYICEMKDLQNIIYEHYKEDLNKHKGKRPKNPNSTHCALSPEELEEFKDRWDTIMER
jgi:hypothetical protein